MASASSVEEDWLRKRNETQEEHIILSVSASFVWLMTELQHEIEEQSSAEQKRRERI